MLFNRKPHRCHSQEDFGVPDKKQSPTKFVVDESGVALPPAQIRELSPAEVEKDAGNAAFKAGAWEEAAERYTNAVLLDSNLSAAFNNRALCLLKLGNFAAAATDCEQVGGEEDRWFDFHPGMRDPGFLLLRNMYGRAPPFARDDVPMKSCPSARRWS